MTWREKAKERCDSVPKCLVQSRWVQGVRADLPRALALLERCEKRIRELAVDSHDEYHGGETFEECNREWCVENNKFLADLNAEE